MRLRQPGFTSSACESFNKSKKRIQKNWRNGRFIIYLSKKKKEIDKACFQNDMAYQGFQDLIRTTFLFNCVIKRLIYEISEIWWISMWTCFNGL